MNTIKGFVRIYDERLNQEKESLLKDKYLADGQIAALTKSLEALQRDLKEKENMVVSIYIYEILFNNAHIFIIISNVNI